MTDEYPRLQLTGVAGRLEPGVGEIICDDGVRQLLEVPGDDQAGVGDQVVELIV